MIKIENVWKQYRLGVIGHQYLKHDVQSWWARVRGKEDPNTPVDLGNNGNGSNRTMWALRDLTLAIQEGEVLGIIGKNGAGKSTLLKVISRVTAPTSGRIKIKGRVTSLLEVGTGFHPELTGRENVFLNGAILGMRVNEVKRKFDEIVDFSGLEPFIDTPVKRYSSGMYVRLAFAVAAHLDSDILILDEVLAVGDAAFQTKSKQKMRGVTGQGRTVLFVSHNMPAISSICSRAILLRRGEVCVDGTPERTIEQYLAEAEEREVPLVDLRDHPNRAEGSIPFFESIELRPGGKLNAGLLVGDSLELRIRFRAAYRFSNMKIAFNIEDHFGGIVARLSPLLRQPELCLHAPKSGEFICVIPSLNLTPGRYNITLDAVDRDNRANSKDLIERACSFEMKDASVLDLPYIPKVGTIFLDSTWDVSSLDGKEESSAPGS